MNKIEQYINKLNTLLILKNKNIFDIIDYKHYHQYLQYMLKCIYEIDNYNNYRIVFYKTIELKFNIYIYNYSFFNDNNILYFYNHLNIKHNKIEYNSLDEIILYDIKNYHIIINVINILLKIDELI